METNALRAQWFVPPALATVAAALPSCANRQPLATRNPSSDVQYEALVAGEVDVVVTAIDNVLAWNQRQGPRDFRVVAQIEQTTPLALVGRPGIASLHALADANILVDSPDNGFVIALKAMLHDVGLGADRYRLTPVGGVKERFDALRSGAGDATLLGPPFDSLALAQGLSLVQTIQARYPAFPGQGVVIRHANEAARPKTAQWLRDLEQARVAMLGQAAWAQSVLAGVGLPAAAVTAMLASVPATLRPDAAGIALLIAHRKTLDLPGSNEQYATIVDESLLPQPAKDRQ
ncbi:MAG: hypothetical protein GAK30_01787 [Paracidovorax wautersii]|uniref:ABC-type nitrate/sulfonate/bicarbonate transport system, substrate-binding protein n=1 Tax=Paracidovorax wautersii TaxID=1177982 RepID=A0A7V8JQE1_9BURK|nr:MAG: hypothetical protein GAK30_01787 [Paracidovorax wautersii]